MPRKCPTSCEISVVAAVADFRAKAAAFAAGLSAFGFVSRWDFEIVVVASFTPLPV
jgi:hypothetical protein